MPNSARAYFRRVRDIAKVIASIEPTVIALQEVENDKVVQDLANRLRDHHSLSYAVAFVQGRDTYTGQDVAYLAGSGIRFRKARFRFSRDLRDDPDFKNLSKHCRLQFEFGGEDFHLVNVHLTTRPADRLRQTRTLREWTREIAEDENLILLGDFNIHLRYEETTRDSDIGIIRGLRERGTADDLLDLHEFLGRRDRATHRRGSHLDRILVSPSLNDRAGFRFADIANRRRLSREVSDHYPLVAVFNQILTDPR